MRTRSALLVLAGALAACGPPRGPSPGGATAPRDIASAPPTAPAPRGPRLEPLEHPRIDVWEQRLRARPRLRLATEWSLARGGPYLPRFQEILAENGLPPSLALLPVVESGFEPRARGRHGERGLWQLRGPTARRFGLVVNARRDDRLHADRATRAAARYLRFLRARFGDWPLALAAYNAGEHRVDRALARKPDATFWQLADRGLLPRTTRDYVPHFLAVVRMSDPSRAQSSGAVASTSSAAARAELLGSGLVE